MLRNVNQERMMQFSPSKIFIHYLKQLNEIMNKVETHESTADILAARLSKDMLPFINQVSTTVNFALRACYPLADMETVLLDREAESFAGLKQQIAAALKLLNEIPEEKITVEKDGSIREKAGFSELALPRNEFLYLYALPNFFFHLNMVYAIARARGVPLSKGDFDGYHQYPDKFSFEE